jgi:two-component system LytT family sensor kinase
LVPTFLLQPLVENAIKHGLRAKPAAGCIHIQSARENGSLVLSVTDNGAGVPVENLKGLEMGVGLGSTCERLARMYADSGNLVVRKAQPVGTEVRVTLPLRLSANSMAGESHEQSATADRR